MTFSSLALHAGSKIRKLKRKITYFRRFHPAMKFCRRRTDIRRFITCAGKRDGSGSQALAMMSTMLFAKDAGLTYVHTPISPVMWEKLPPHLYDPEWQNEWEQFFNLGCGDISSDVLMKSGLSCRNISRIDEIDDYTDNVLYVIRHCHDYANNFSRRYRSIYGILRRKYFSSSKEKYESYYDADALNIAIHIRRGEVNSTGEFSGRYTSTDYISSILDHILEILNCYRVPISVGIYSDGDLEEFRNLAHTNVHFHLNECPFSTFHNLVNADLLVVAKSAFSYAAALLSQGVKLCEPFDPDGFIHKPLPEWVIMGRDGTIERGRLTRRLAKLPFMNRPARHNPGLRDRRE